MSAGMEQLSLGGGVYPASDVDQEENRRKCQPKPGPPSHEHLLPTSGGTEWFRRRLDADITGHHRPSGQGSTGHFAVRHS